MPQYTPRPNYRCLGAFLLVIGICSVCGGFLQGFGDRMPNPPPDIKAEFEAINRRMEWMIVGGGVFALSGAICIAATMTSGKTDWRNQKRD